MSCVTAFGFSPGNVWKYQKVTDPAERRPIDPGFGRQEFDDGCFIFFHQHVARGAILVADIVFVQQAE